MTAALYENICLTGSSYIVDKIDDIRTNQDSGEVELLIFWKGFESTDSTWEPFATIVEDVPKLVRGFLKTSPSDSFCMSFLDSF